MTGTGISGVCAEGHEYACGWLDAVKKVALDDKPTPTPAHSTPQPTPTPIRRS